MRGEEAGKTTPQTEHGRRKQKSRRAVGTRHKGGWKGEAGAGERRWAWGGTAWAGGEQHLVLATH